ncbi:MAG TPA: NUDIX hydrolase, partial [Longilinea sp.]|nr:NUDIX hydrolase [Longilinea sp.]
MRPGKIRPIVLCIFQHRSRILVSEGYDHIKQEAFYRPLGGGIEFGESSKQAIIREIREELAQEITALRYLGTLENIFTYNGETGHEIVFVYDGKFTDPSVYQKTTLNGIEDKDHFTAIWMPVASFKNHVSPLYPTG